MKILRTIQEMQEFSQINRQNGKRIGFVPTMGFLHEGHLSLIKLAKNNADIVVVSIFVNPTQFGKNEDLSKYPRDFARDEKLCVDNKVNAIFYPVENEMYDNNFSTWVTEKRLTTQLCAKSRPTHFRGVTTIVAKLFNAVLPDIAVFGQKDAQQLLIICKMVNDLNFPIKIITGEIIREKDGLAMSSRNKYLSITERKSALIINQALNDAKKMINNGENNSENIYNYLFQKITKNGGKIDYAEILNCKSLRKTKKIMLGKTLVAVAVFYGKTRLIDNFLI